ncbi:MAG TPA: phosphatidylserine decarboxylase family protein [Flavobacteriales bacterium]|jgi:phosphatidylserine decarboxylase|nr:phosphatidylserine decarboxylase family protein [Flavobacteriales bacterium]|tara:strand:+ start:703 stop:1350 length:648 start_codon:yes stop_codon:yes gene_type:complete
MKLHKEGIKILRNEILIFTLVNYITYWNSELIFWFFTLPLAVFLFVMSVYFFRVPKRDFQRKEGCVYAPCDGRVVVIEQAEENEYYKDKRLQISIFMSPLNVHNNIYPISGKVTYTKYHRGKFLVAWHPKASTDNERNTIVVENNKISVLLRQIAGAFARRIISYPNVGDSATTSDEFGFIKFGSRVDVLLPIGTKVTTKLNQKVKSGITVIAVY